MKVLEEKKTVEITTKTYVSDDGLVFDSECACKEHERQVLYNQLENIEQCKEAENLPNCDGGENYESHSYVWYRPKTQEDVCLLRRVYDMPDVSFLNKWICIELDSEGEYLWYTYLADGINYVKDLLSRLGYDVTITPKQIKGE